MELIAMEWEGVDCVNLTYDRELWEPVVNCVMNLCIP